MSYVVDTNVAKVANGDADHCDEECQLACIEKLELIVNKKSVGIDTLDLIFDEYKKHLNFKGSPGVGDMFFKHLNDNKYKERNVKRFEITESNNDDKGFEELPYNTLDKSDRKFLAVAKVSGFFILNASDSDWKENEQLLNDMSINIEQLCEC